jgi:uncharacterized membrane protein
MNGRYFAYAVVVTLVVTLINWFSFLESSTNRSGRGSGWSSHSSGGWGGGGGGHK